MACSTSPSPAAFHTLFDQAADDFYMSKAPASNPRKRQRTELHPPSEALLKKQRKLNCHSGGGYIDTPAFWDSLSKIWLTKYALRELNRRNTPQHHPLSRRVRRPVTRGLLAERRTAGQRPNVSDLLRNASLSHLKDIKRFARHGGPDLLDLVGYPEPTVHTDREMSSRRSSSIRNAPSSSSLTKTSGKTSTADTTARRTKSGKSKKSGTSNPADANYQQKLIDSGVIPYGCKRLDGSRPSLPSGWDEINQRLAQPRPSLSPSRFPEEAYQNFVEADADAFNEDAVKDSVLPVMLGAMGASQGAQKNILFTNTAPIAAGIAKAKPDYYYGAQPGQIHPRIRHPDPDVGDPDIRSHIIPSKHDHLPAVPNFSLEAKGPDGSAAVARRQACHNGALGARAIQSLHVYGQTEPIYDNQARTISTVYHEGQLKMYGHSVAQPNGPGTQPEYYMHQLGGWSMTDNSDRNTFLRGATAFKNARDLTEEYRNDAIMRANKVAARTTGEEDHDVEGDEDQKGTGEDTEDEDTDEEEAESSKTARSFDYRTSQDLSTLIEDEGESETSMEDDSQSRPPAKRSSSKVHRSHRRKRRTGSSSSRSRAATVSLVPETSISQQPPSQQATTSCPADCYWDGQYHVSNLNSAYIWNGGGWIPRPPASHHPVVQSPVGVPADSHWDGQYYVSSQNPAYVWSGNDWIQRP